MDKLIRDTLEEMSSVYSRTRKVKKAIFLTSFYSTHPHYRWHIDLQDMSIFKKSKKASGFNFMLICVDDFNNYFMVKLLQNKKASTVHNAMIKLIQEEGNISTIVYCDQGSEFNNKLFNDPYENGFSIQFTIDHRKAVYAERAI